MIGAGSMVRFVKMPVWVSELPPESKRVFEFCLGRVYRVDEIDQRGLLVLDVSENIDKRFGGFGNDIRLEPEFLDEIP